MEFFRSYRKIFTGVATGFFLACAIPVANADEAGDKWQTAGKEVKEAADAVIEATKDSSGRAWKTARLLRFMGNWEGEMYASGSKGIRIRQRANGS